MRHQDITLVLGVDAQHLRELRHVWPDWMRFKPELREMPCLVFYDVKQVRTSELKFLSDHPQLRLIAWDLPHARNQREKMLTGFVNVPAREVKTPWYLKIDTDVFATAPGEWIRPEWFRPDEKGDLPVFIASPWGYSKPRYVMDVMDDWADGVPKLAVKPRLNLPYSSTSSKVRHPRIISWLFFGRTDWTREMAALTVKENRLPYPSQDSFMVYCAERLGKRYVRAQMAEHGWKHQRHPRHQVKLAAAPPVVTERARGVIYYNTGTSCAVRLLVSLVSLRKQYSGPVTILTEGEESHVLCKKIGSSLDADVIEWNCEVPPGKHRAYLAKTRYHDGTPYDTTIALDSDTLITGAIEELFEKAEQHTFCVAQLAKWRSDGRIIGRRLRQWENLLPEFFKPALAFGPAINCGIVAFQKNAPLCADWLSYALPGREFFIPDEVACQLILHRYPHCILDGRWNRSCRHDNPDLPDTRIIHYHGRKHCRQGLPYHGDKWMEVYEEVVRQNLADIQSWTPAGDRQLRRYLKSLSQTPKSSSKGHVYETNLWCRRGHLNHDQADKYAEICAQVNPKYVLETGFCTGRSAACVLHNSPALQRMISIDINLDYNARHGRRMAALLKKQFPVWDVIENSSRVILTPEFFQQEYPQGIDLATIDGDHTYEGCMFDLEAMAPFLTPGGVMIVDDYRSGPPHGARLDSVTRSVDDFLARHSGLFVGERWNNKGKGFCIIKRDMRIPHEFGTSPEGRSDGTRRYIVLGAGRTKYPGWISTERDVFDVTKEEDYRRWLDKGLANRFLAEHVWEHLSDDALTIANALIFKYLRSGGCLRIAVPDGLHPDPDYIEHVRPGGSGPAAHDHKRLFTHQTLAACLEVAGFSIDKLEYWDEAGDFHFKPWDSNEGHIKRSAKHDRRNRKRRLAYTSLIVDARKP